MVGVYLLKGSVLPRLTLCICINYVYAYAYVYDFIPAQIELFDKYTHHTAMSFTSAATVAYWYTLWILYITVNRVFSWIRNAYWITTGVYQRHHRQGKSLENNTRDYSPTRYVYNQQTHM